MGSWLLYPTLQAPVLDNAQRPESVTEDRWHQPYSEPRRDGVAKAFAIALAVASGLTFCPQPPVANVTVDRFFVSLSEPVKVPARLITGAQEACFFGRAAPFPEAVTIDRWQIALSEPVRIKPRLPEPEQQTLALHPSPVVSFSWFSWLSDPVRVKQRLAEPDQQATFFHPTPVVSFSWFSWLHDPVRVKARLPEPEQQFLALCQADPFPESVTIDRWLFPFGEPVRVPLRLATGSQPFFSFHSNPLVSFGWFGHLAEPIRLNLLRGIAAPYQQTLAIDPKVLTLKEAVLESKWHQPWSEPVRFRIVPAWKIAIDSASGGVLGIDPSTFPIPVPSSIRRPLFYQSAGAIWKGRSSG